MGARLARPFERMDWTTQTVTKNNWRQRQISSGPKLCQIQHADGLTHTLRIAHTHTYTLIKLTIQLQGIIPLPEGVGQNS